ncbi:MAG: ABC transporter permease [Actinomycetaceae bacterium]|nr:ABC transporter permease [Actinomycetaceae bacterium]
MLIKLALGNVRKSARDYMIYFVTISFSVALLYAFNTIDTHVDMLPHRRLIIETIDSLMNIMSYMLIVALALLIIYANNYLIRRRTKEFALYQVFGMRRRDVAKILTTETFVSSLGALLVGLILGVLLSQFLVFVTGRIVEETVSNYHFVFRPEAIGLTVISFGVIFLITLALNLVTLRRLQLVELMKHSRTNEVSRLKSPWVMFALFVSALALIGLAYWRLLTIGYPFDAIYAYGNPEATAEVWGQFAFTTLLVCVGTYLFFYSLGGALLFFARTSRSVYWRGLNMFTVREFASKIKSAALSMGSISIVLFLMLSVITPTFGVTSSMRETIEENAPYDVTFEVGYDTYRGVENEGEDREAENKRREEFNVENAIKLLEEKGILQGISASNTGVYLGRFVGEDARVLLTPSLSVSYMTDDYGQPLEDARAVPSLSEYIEASGYDTSQWGYGIDQDFTRRNYYSFEVVPVSAYNARRALSGLAPMPVGEGQYAISYAFAFEGLTDLYRSALNSGLEIEVAGQKLKPAGGASIALDESEAAIFIEDFIKSNDGVLIVPDSVFAEIENAENVTATIYGAINFDNAQPSEYFQDDFSDYMYGPFICEEEDAQQCQTLWFIGAFATQVSVADGAIEVLGVAIYVSIYMGFVLAMISAAMLAIQVLSGFSEAAPRYRRLSQLGALRGDVNRSVALQIAWYFVLPLAVAACHAWVAVVEALKIVEFIVPLSISRGAVMTGLLVVGVYGVYALLSYWSAKALVSSEADLAER